MAIPTKPAYTHGSTGTKPSVARDYQNGDPLDANEFDYYLNTLFETQKDLIDALNVIDSDDDGTVDEADYALNADQVDGQDYSDIQTWVETNATIDETQLSSANASSGQYLQTDGTTVTWVDLNIPVRTSDPSAPADGEVWIRSDT